MDVCTAIEIVANSGCGTTANLQVPYLLSIAVMIADFLPSFPPAPRATLDLLDKLDHAFSSLLQGKDVDTGDSLPGFGDGRTISTTDKVRLKSIVEHTKVTVVKRMSGENVDAEEEEAPAEKGGGDAMDVDSATENDGADNTVHFEGFEDEDEEYEEDEWEMQVARVYERTIAELGDVLGGPPIGIITDV